MSTTSRKKLTLTDLVEKTCFLISAGRLDSHLEAIMAECNARRVVVRDQRVRKNMRELNKPGTRVRITGNIKPQYLLGASGKVVDKPVGWVSARGRRATNGETIYVDFGRPIRKYGPVVGVPASALEAA